MNPNSYHLPDPPAPARVLVVDDEDHVRRLVVRWLTGAGHACAEAADARSARDHLDDREVDLAVMDINMPGESGLELLEHIRETRPHTAVVMITGRSEVHSAIEALTHGASGYLLKPMKRGELLFHAGRALERRQLILEREQYTRRLEARIREQTETIRLAHEETIHRLVTASMYRDEETGAHIQRTGLASEVLAKAAGWSDERAERLRLAAPMHDVGKIGIPDAVLQKPGKLTPDEFEVMKTHTRIGAAMLEGSHSPMLQMARDIALAHHEHWDGNGYPRGLTGADIPEAARIVALVDVYDALTHDRVYRSAMPEDEALRIMHGEAGRHFDPRLFELLLSVLGPLRAIAEAHPDPPATAADVPAPFPALSPWDTAAAGIACTL